MKLRSILLLSLVAVGVAAVTVHADVRTHKYSDGSMLLDDDDHGQRLVTPQENGDAEYTVAEHYGEINPNSLSEAGTKRINGKRSFAISFDIAPSRILSQDELFAWAESERKRLFWEDSNRGWWWYDLLFIIYRNYERRSKVTSAQDPGRAQGELKQKNETARIPDPSSALVKRLASHGIQYSSKIYNGQYMWYFAIKDPHSARELDFHVPVGASEQAIIREAYASTAEGFPDPSEPSSARQLLH
jgi:hypothetical protein